jgi:hypothetical protein
MSGSTSHLRQTELVDLVEGTLPPSRLAHLESCAACRQQAADLSATMQDARGVDVPEPPPFFWEQLSARLRSEVASEPLPGRRGWRALQPGTRRAWLATAAALAIAVALWQALLPSPYGGSVVVDVPLNVEQTSEPPDEDGFGDIETDEGWALVRTIADELPSEAMDEEGIGPRPGSAEALAYRMSDLERIALAQILEDEMKQPKRPEAAS